MLFWPNFARRPPREAVWIVCEQIVDKTPWELLFTVGLLAKVDRGEVFHGASTRCLQVMHMGLRISSGRGDVDFLAQEIDILADLGIGFHLILNAVHGVNHRAVVASAEVQTDRFQGMLG